MTPQFQYEETYRCSPVISGVLLIRLYAWPHCLQADRTLGLAYMDQLCACIASEILYSISDSIVIQTAKLILFCVCLWVKGRTMTGSKVTFSCCGVDPCFCEDCVASS